MSLLWLFFLYQRRWRSECRPSLSVTSETLMAFGRSCLLANTSNTASRSSSCNWHYQNKNHFLHFIIAVCVIINDLHIHDLHSTANASLTPILVSSRLEGQDLRMFIDELSFMFILMKLLRTSLSILCSSSLASPILSRSLLSTTNIRPCVFWK